MRYKDKYKNSVHSETIFHVCNNIEGLKGILKKNAFIPSFSREVVYAKGDKTPYYFVPMVSFCDFKLSEMDFHFQKYGKYGIGLSKEWGIKNDLNPVLYINDECVFFQDFRKALIDSFNEINGLSGARNSQGTQEQYESIININNKLLEIYCYIKNYQGELDRNGEIIEDFRFADDKEWRYVPKIVGVLDALGFRWPIRLIGFNETDNIKIKNRKTELNKNISKSEWLRFDYDDVKFLIVPNEVERYNLIKAIYKINVGGCFGCIDKALLISKIVIVDHLDL
ncbi:abortive infection system antitoxin AbiGi family protein [Candidatus Methylospira mobilis]|uniref:abortive infection system antitoxin AbiGi family protein n=1 Tax=Candidatus Methylospira mobilis TaxID=1808979 RepID=UPI0028EFAF5F|nr:abortive infection system antitoxin AbiGi family protein [Candidatus Methylospira mobilis]WNV06303.1 abortive infection system antitoxin AbiGi family protein [Candidatus Methylospira mobilis]